MSSWALCASVIKNICLVLFVKFLFLFCVFSNYKSEDEVVQKVRQFVLHAGCGNEYNHYEVCWFNDEIANQHFEHSSPL